MKEAKRAISKRLVTGGGATGGPGFLKKIGNTLLKPFTTTLNYDREEYMKNRPVMEPVKREYDVRGVKVNDEDLDESAHVLYGEISNRIPDRQKFEVRNIVNTGINRALARKKSLTQVFQEPYQYQGYAPKGITLRGGKIAKSEYQKVKENDPSVSKEKMKIIREALEELKSGKFEDTTGGAQFYVHASDGTMWLGKTLQEAKNNARMHETRNRLGKTRFGTTTGLPAF